MAHRFFIEQKIQKGAIEIKNVKLAHQLSNVLRMERGEIIELFNGDGFEHTARIVLITKNTITAAVFETRRNKRELSTSLILCLALIKKERMEWAFEKCTEIGIRGFQPIITERSLAKNISKERSLKIIRESAEQSGRGMIPSYSAPLPLDEVMDACLRARAVGIFFDSSYESALSIAKLSALIPRQQGTVYLFIGPEGGFTPNEVRRAEARGIQAGRIYPTILRSETAAIACSGIMAMLSTAL